MGERGAEAVSTPGGRGGEWRGDAESDLQVACDGCVAMPRSVASGRRAGWVGEAAEAGRRWGSTPAGQEPSHERPSVEFMSGKSCDKTVIRSN